MESQNNISLTDKQIEKFNNRICIEDKTECHIFTAYKDKLGYGYMSINNKKMAAPRIAWLLAYGKIPEGLCVLHKCDNPSCVNPKHLFLGTFKDNMIDKIQKGRNRDSRHQDDYFKKLLES